MLEFMNWLAPLLCAIGALNWGLVAFFKFNLVEWLDKLFGSFGLDKIIYALVGLSGLYLILSISFKITINF